jgi:hypothetical protein
MAAATSADLSSAVAVVHAAGGVEVSVLQNGNAPRVEFNLEADDEGQAACAAQRALQRLTEATPMLAGGWILVSILAA